MCQFARECLQLAETLESDSTVAYDTELRHVFFDGTQWHSNPLRHGPDVGWHTLLFEGLCHTIIRDLRDYGQRHPDETAYPKPTILIIMPLSRSGIPFTVLVQRILEEEGIEDGVVHVSLPLNTRGESVPIVHADRHRRSLGVEDQYCGTQ